MPKVLIVLTSCSEGTWGKPTGFWLEELAAPYYEFKKAGFDIDIASIAGGKAPLDEMSKQEEYQTEDTRRFLEDASAMANVDATRPISEFVANASTYGAVFLPGGHGTAVDFADNADLKAVLEAVYANGGVVSAVCHGPCGLVAVHDIATGKPLVADKRVTGFSDEEEKAVGMYGKVPFSLEKSLRDLGGKYESTEPWGCHVCNDDRVVTGQNPASSKDVAKAVVDQLKTWK